jgi:hypothetical protein
MKFVVFFCYLLFITKANAQVLGCTDPLATNYNAAATDNNGSCVYAGATIAPIGSVVLSDSLVETSGLIKWNNQLWTHNDDKDRNIYAIDTGNGKILIKQSLSGVVNTDWEDIAQDSAYIYLGDFGNNVNGNRKDLHILRIEKLSLMSASPKIDTIYFSYADQTDFSPTGANNTDYDCEAFIVTKDSIYLFTKQWLGNKSDIYALSKMPGTQVATRKNRYDVAGLITGATYLETKKLIVLSGYNSLLQPFVYLLYDFKGNDFWGGNKRKINLSLPFCQIEGIASDNGLNFYLTNEYFFKSPIKTMQQLHHIDMSDYLSLYLKKTLNIKMPTEKKSSFSIYPNPTNDVINIYSEKYPKDFKIFDVLGRIVFKSTINEKLSTINLLGLPSGVYFLKMDSENEAHHRFEKN